MPGDPLTWPFWNQACTQPGLGSFDGIVWGLHQLPISWSQIPDIDIASYTSNIPHNCIGSCVGLERSVNFAFGGGCSLSQLSAMSLAQVPLRDWIDRRIGGEARHRVSSRGA